MGGQRKTEHHIGSVTITLVEQDRNHRTPYRNEAVILIAGAPDAWTIGPRARTFDDIYTAIEEMDRLIGQVLDHVTSDERLAWLLSGDGQAWQYRQPDQRRSVHVDDLSDDEASRLVEDLQKSIKNGDR